MLFFGVCEQHVSFGEIFSAQLAAVPFRQAVDIRNMFAHDLSKSVGLVADLTYEVLLFVLLPQVLEESAKDVVLFAAVPAARVGRSHGHFVDSIAQIHLSLHPILFSFKV